MIENWELKPLQDICEVFVDGNWIESKDQSDEGIRLIQTGNIGFGTYKDKSDKSRYISEETFTKLKCTEVLPGDILVSRLPDPVGKSCLIPEINSKMITGVDCTIIRLKDFISAEYVKYYQMSEQYLKDVNLKVTGTTRSRISRKNLGTINIPYPSKEKQKQIVEFLDKAFEAIDKAKENLEKNIQNSKELFQSRLNEIFSQKGEGWEESTILEICKDIFAGGDKPEESFSKEKTEKFTIPIFANAVKDKGLYGYTNKARVNESAITISARGSGTGHTEIRTESFFPIVRLIVLIPNREKVSLVFLKYIIDNLDILRSGSAIPQLTVPMIKEYIVNYPSLKKQNEIITELDNLNEQTKQLEKHYQQKLENLEELKKSILQKAFSGELV